MKLVTFEIMSPVGKLERLGALLDGRQDGRIVDLTVAYAEYLRVETDEPMPDELAALRTPPSMIGWLKGAHKSREAVDQAIAYVKRHASNGSDLAAENGAKLVYDAKSVRLLAPIPRPHGVRDFSIYADHMTKADRGGEKKPKWYTHPPYYKGNPNTIVGPGDPIPYPYYTERLDLEIELGFIIGRQGSDLTVDQAKDCIAGYTIFIDPSCRDGYDREPFGQTKRKDFCTAIGPCIVTPDEVDPFNLPVRVTVDGETWFTGNTNAARSFDLEQLVAYASDNETIYPGDVFGTGTIGFGCAMDYHKWLKVGQTITFEIEGIGTMTHTIVEGRRIVEHVGGMKGRLTQKM